MMNIALNLFKVKNKNITMPSINFVLIELLTLNIFSKTFQLINLLFLLMTLNMHLPDGVFEEIVKFLSFLNICI